MKSFIAVALFVPFLLFIGFGLGPVTSPSPVQDSDELSAGWENLPAAEFVQQAVEILDSTNARHKGELIEHGWGAFLNVASFVADEELSTVQAMIDGFGGRGADRVQAGVAQAVVDADTANLTARFAARLAASDWLNNQAFTEFMTRIKTLQNSGQTGKETSVFFAQWMANNDWQSLSLSELSDLLHGLGQNDQVSASGMSARWTGSVTAPGNGDFTFELVRQFNNDPHYKLWVGGQQVLDSSAQPEAEFFTSEPVALRNGTATSIRLEMTSSDGDLEYSRGGPAAVLRWKSGQAESQYVPSIALSPPVGFAEGSGLKGEYFADTGFQDRVLERLDSSLEYVWNWGAIAPVYHTQCQAVIDHSFSKLTQAGFLGSIPADEQALFVQKSVGYLAGHLTMSQRERLAGLLRGQVELLEATSNRGMGSLMNSIYLLPNNEHLDLLVQWSNLRPQPRALPGAMNEDTAGSYADNWSPYWQIGRLLTGPHWRDAETLLSDHLVRENGNCNLVVAYATTFSARDATGGGHPRKREFRSLLQDKLDDESTQGDARVTWLIARAFAAEWGNSYSPKIYKGKEFLEEASLIAESDDYRFWAFHELAARYASMAQVEKLTTLLDNGGAGFSAADQRAALDLCRTRCEALVEAYAEHNRVKEVAANASYVAELRNQISKAQQRGSQSDAARFQSLLDSASSQ